MSYIALIIPAFFTTETNLVEIVSLTFIKTFLYLRKKYVVSSFNVRIKIWKF